MDVLSSSAAAAAVCTPAPACTAAAATVPACSLVDAAVVDIACAVASSSVEAAPSWATRLPMLASKDCGEPGDPPGAGERGRLLRIPHAPGLPGFEQMGAEHGKRPAHRAHLVARPEFRHRRLDRAIGKLPGRAVELREGAGDAAPHDGEHRGHRQGEEQERDGQHAVLRRVERRDPGVQQGFEGVRGLPVEAREPVHHLGGDGGGGAAGLELLHEMREAGAEGRVIGIERRADGVAAGRAFGRRDRAVGAFEIADQRAEPDQELRPRLRVAACIGLGAGEVGQAVERVRQAVQDDVGEVIGVEHVIEDEVRAVADADDQVAQPGAAIREAGRVAQGGDRGFRLGLAVEHRAVRGLDPGDPCGELGRGAAGDGVGGGGGLRRDQGGEIACACRFLGGEFDRDALLGDQRPDDEGDRQRKGARGAGQLAGDAQPRPEASHGGLPRDDPPRYGAEGLRDR